MLTIRQTEVYRTWFASLRDVRAKAHILRRLERAQTGNLGDVSPVGGGVSEMRIHYGPGYRVYFIQRGDALIILLCGGDKSGQSRDITQARRLAQEV